MCGSSEHLVTQIFGAACPVAYNDHIDACAWKELAMLVLKASYEAALWGALEQMKFYGGAHASNKIFLTLLGDGVFGNDIFWIAQSLEWALQKFTRKVLEVYIVVFQKPYPIEILTVASKFTLNIAMPSVIAENQARASDESRIFMRC